MASVQQIAAAANGISASLLLCGHSHLPRVVALPDGRLIVNPGSVGLPAYDDDHPYPHRVENGSPHARYAICERGGDGWRIDLRAVPYDFRAAAQLAGENGAPDWARWLSSGWVAQ